MHSQWMYQIKLLPYFYFSKDADSVVVFHAGTAVKVTEGKEEVVTSGGRVMAIVGLAQGITDAQKTAYDSMTKICFDGIQYRSDIASSACRYDFTPSLNQCHKCEILLEW